MPKISVYTITLWVFTETRNTDMWWLTLITNCFIKSSKITTELYYFMSFSYTQCNIEVIAYFYSLYNIVRKPDYQGRSGSLLQSSLSSWRAEHQLISNSVTALWKRPIFGHQQTKMKSLSWRIREINIQIKKFNNKPTGVLSFFFFERTCIIHTIKSQTKVGKYELPTLWFLKSLSLFLKGKWKLLH